MVDKHHDSDVHDGLSQHKKQRSRVNRLGRTRTTSQGHDCDGYMISDIISDIISNIVSDMITNVICDMGVGI